jgi:hypothetical protein
VSVLCATVVTAFVLPGHILGDGTCTVANLWEPLDIIKSELCTVTCVNVQFRVQVHNSVNEQGL